MLNNSSVVPSQFAISVLFPACCPPKSMMPSSTTHDEWPNLLYSSSWLVTQPSLVILIQEVMDPVAPPPPQIMFISMVC